MGKALILQNGSIGSVSGYEFGGGADRTFTMPGAGIVVAIGQSNRTAGFVAISVNGVEVARKTIASPNTSTTLVGGCAATAKSGDVIKISAGTGNAGYTQPVFSGYVLS